MSSQKVMESQVEIKNDNPNPSLVHFAQTLANPSDLPGAMVFVVLHWNEMWDKPITGWKECLRANSPLKVRVSSMLLSSHNVFLDMKK